MNFNPNNNKKINSIANNKKWNDKMIIVLILNYFYKSKLKKGMELMEIQMSYFHFGTYLNGMNCI